MRGQKNCENLDRAVAVLFNVLVLFGPFCAEAIASQLTSSKANVSLDADSQNTIQVDILKSDASLKKLNLTVYAEYQSNLRKNSSPDQENSSTLGFAASYKIQTKTSLLAELEVTKLHNSEGSTDLTNLALGLTPIEYELSSELVLKPMLYAILPTSQKSRDDSTYRGAVMIRPVLQYKPLRIPDLTISNSIYLGRNFHEYEVQRNYSPNNEYSFRYRLDVGYKISSKVGVGARTDFARAITYSGFSKDDFYFMQYFDYSIDTSWSAYFLHENRGAVRGPNNFGNNIEVFNEKSSFVSLGLQRVF